MPLAIAAPPRDADRLRKGRRRVSRTARNASRKLWMGLQTVLGLRERGVFIPYRYAESLPKQPGVYREIEALLDSRRASLKDVVARIDRFAGDLRALEGPPPAPRWRQDWFPRLDAAVAYALIRSAPPKRILEVGSGHSTRFLARALKDAGASAEHLCIDPAPRAALLDLPVTWRNEVLSEDHLPLFAALEAGDVAMFDSSHLLLEGSDVDIQLNRILPVLRRGVLVHIHDVFLPDPYPADWKWRGYNEQAGLGGWIAGQGAEVVFASRYAATRIGVEDHPAIAALPTTGAPSSSLWLRRL